MGEGEETAVVVRESAEGIEPEVIFETLSNRRRRYVIDYLKRHTGSVTVRDLSEQVAAWENDVSPTQVTPKERKRVYTALHQTHLPKMREVGVVDYDRDRGTVELTPEIASFDIYLDVVPSQELDWGGLLLGLGVLGVALAVALAVDLYPLTLLPDVAYVALVSVAVLLVGASHVLSRRRTLFGGRKPAVGGPDPPDRDA